jgi:hypothetical protein
VLVVFECCRPSKSVEIGNRVREVSPARDDEMAADGDGRIR